MNQPDSFEIKKLRSTLGIQSDAFELSEEDYWNLYQFAQPINYAAFKEACDQINAQHPAMELLKRLENRFNNESD